MRARGVSGAILVRLATGGVGAACVVVSTFLVWSTPVVGHGSRLIYSYRPVRADLWNLSPGLGAALLACSAIVVGLSAGSRLPERVWWAASRVMLLAAIIALGVAVLRWADPLDPLKGVSLAGHAGLGPKLATLGGAALVAAALVPDL